MNKELNNLKVCFIWVENFRNFENFGFNLSSSYKFKYNCEENVLNINDIVPLPDNFFGERIDDVVGIIGKNGSGKSNAVELVCNILKGSKTSFQKDFLVVVESEGKLVCYYSLLNGIKPKADSAGLDVLFKEYEGIINPLKVIYFSNVFDERKIDFGKEVSDISVNNLSRLPAYLGRGKVTNFEKQIRLINSKIFSSLNIDLPTRVLLTSTIWKILANPDFGRYTFSSSYKIIKELTSLFRARLREIKPENKFIHLLKFGFFLESLSDFFRKIYRFDSNYISQIENRLNEFVEDLIKLKTTEEISEGLLDFLDHETSILTPEQTELFLRYEKEDSESFLERIEKQIYFLRSIKYFIKDINLQYDTEGHRNRGLDYFILDYKSPKSKDFVNEYINLIGQSRFFNINWIGISSGHKAYINLFASIYQELLYTRQPNLLICIDEGDLYLHPMWQTEFFDRLVHVLPAIFSGNIQIILTSHSPFLLSDLPKQNITILDKDYPGSSLDGTELSINTFGGNLYDLYSEPFFLKKKRTSDFAYHKIKKLIDAVENKLLTSSEKIELSKLVDLIGDEIIRFRLKRTLEND